MVPSLEIGLFFTPKCHGWPETVLADRRLRWPDTFSEGPDGTMYVTASRIQDTQWFTPDAPPSIKSSSSPLPPSADPRSETMTYLRHSLGIEHPEPDEQATIDGIIQA